MSDFNQNPPAVSAGREFDQLGLVHRVRTPEGAGPHPTLIMLHGLYGNEDVTWVFARAVTREWLVLTPRALLQMASGYAWFAPTVPPDPFSLTTALGVLHRFIAGVDVYGGDPARVVLLGFSQGAAMAYLVALGDPAQVRGVAALSGFVPNLNRQSLPPLNGLPILMLHGTRDETIPVAYARSTRDALQEAGAALTYEEAEIGHKTSAAQMRTLAAWLAARLAEL